MYRTSHTFLLGDRFRPSSFYPSSTRELQSVLDGRSFTSSWFFETYSCRIPNMHSTAYTRKRTHFTRFTRMFTLIITSFYHRRSPVDLWTSWMLRRDWRSPGLNCHPRIRGRSRFLKHVAHFIAIILRPLCSKSAFLAYLRHSIDYI